MLKQGMGRRGIDSNFPTRREGERDKQEDDEEGEECCDKVLDHH